MPRHLMLCLTWIALLGISLNLARAAEPQLYALRKGPFKAHFITLGLRLG